LIVLGRPEADTRDTRSVIAPLAKALDPTLRLRLQRELDAVSTLGSPHIVRVLEVGTDAETGRPFVRNEVFPGEDLAALLTRIDCLPPRVALTIASQMLAAITRAHSAGVLHRDVRPQNVVLTHEASGEVIVKVQGFGIAALTVDRLSGDLAPSADTNTFGSPQYLAPEQLQSTLDVDPRTDVWAVGLVLFRMLTGATPHPEASFGRILSAIATKPVRDVRELAPWVPVAIADIVRRATRIAPSERYKSANAMEGLLSVGGG